MDFVEVVLKFWTTFYVKEEENGTLVGRIHPLPGS